jgi:uncharacterized protein YcbK (DUF882 family)
MRKIATALAAACVSAFALFTYATFRHQAIAALAIPQEQDEDCAPEDRAACGVVAPWMVEQTKAAQNEKKDNLFRNYAAHVRATVNTSCLPGSIKAALARVQAQCGGVTIISAHRASATIAGSGKPSYHASCRAADFTMRDYRCGMRALAGWGGGLSTDPHRVAHLHMDLGPRIRFAHGGGGSRYASHNARAAFASAAPPASSTSTTW